MSSNEGPATSRDLLTQVLEARAAVLDSGRTAAVRKQHALGKLTARERIDRLLDPDTFREVGSLVEPRRDGPAESVGDAPADGVVTGSGKIDGRPVSVVASDFTVHGGSFGLVGASKAERQAELSFKHGYPMVQVHDGGGHRIQEALDAADAARGIGIVNGFSTLSDMSGWVPMVCAMLGPTFAAPANVSAMADFVVIVRGIGRIGIAGPALVRLALGEESTAEQLGDPDVQAEQNGIVDLVADDEASALASVRRFLSYLPSNASQGPPTGPSVEPARDPASLVDIVPATLRRAYDVRQVIDGVVDADSVFELKPRFAQSLVTSFARLGGRPIGVVANQPMHMAGSLTADATEKAARFISMCDAFGLPLLFLVDTPGLLVGKAAESAALLRRSAKIVHELGQATVPRFTVVLRKGYGLGYILMGGGRDFDSDCCLIWPTAELCGMQVEGAVDVAHRKEIAASSDPQAKRAELIDRYRSYLGIFRAASAFGIDEVIDPADTRGLLLEALGRARNRRVRRTSPRQHPIPPI